MDMASISRMLECSAEGVIASGPDGTVTLFNPSAERMTGLAASDITGRPISKALPESRIPEVLASGIAQTGRLLRMRGLSVIADTYPLTHDGKPAGAFELLHDVTELEALTLKLGLMQNSGALMEAVIEATDDAISVADEHGNNAIVNQAYTRITGLSKEQVIGKPATVDISGGGQSMHMEVLRTGKPVRNVRMRVGPAGREVIVNVAPIVIDGRLRGSVGTIHDISEIRHLTEELMKTRRLLRSAGARYKWDDIIGQSPGIEAARKQAMLAAGTDATVLIRGASGTGKELFAHAIHNASSRHKGQFVRVNCAAIAESLLESELFGYEEGAFTGALKGGKVGYFEEAGGGTIFLDEIGDLSPAMQSRLLRVLQEREITRVGGTRAISVDVRVITATNADLESRIAEGLFRADLYYRINVIAITVIPLRERREDIPLIIESMLPKLNADYHREVKGITPDAIAALQGYHWPGNVRELMNLIGRAMLNMLPQENTIEADHLPLGLLRLGSGPALKQVRPARPLSEALDDAERKALTDALAHSGGRREEAAGLLGISLRSLYYKLRRHSLE